MSDIPPNFNFIPQLPDEVMYEIIFCCDGPTILNLRSICRYWRQKLTSYEFLIELTKRWLYRGYHLYAHFGHSFALSNSVDWVMKMDASTGEATPFTLPFHLSFDGWFQIVGLDNGIFCIRYCSMGGPSYLLTWNPVSRMSRIIADPSKNNNDGDLAYLYAFTYYPNSLHYAILNIFKQETESLPYTLTIYTSFRRNWDERITCPNYVRNLDSSYVSVNGTVYWITSHEHGSYQEHPYIVSFSILSLTFRQIFIFSEAMGHCHSLLVQDGHVCLAANTQDDESYTTCIWQLDDNDNSVFWTKLSENGGRGAIYVPTIVVDTDLIQIMERHIHLNDFDDIQFSQFKICRYNPFDHTRKTLQWLEYNGEVELRYLNVYYQGMFPV